MMVEGLTVVLPVAENSINRSSCCCCFAFHFTISVETTVAAATSCFTIESKVVI